jgi:hypothetical protein
MIGHFIQLTAVLIRCFSVRIGIHANCIETYETYETKPKQTCVSVTETDTKLCFSFNTFLSIAASDMLKVSGGGNPPDYLLQVPRVRIVERWVA